MKKEWYITKKISKKLWRKRIKGKWMIKRMKYKKEGKQRRKIMKENCEWERIRNEKEERIIIL